jgi:hypothetical protein
MESQDGWEAGVTKEEQSLLEHQDQDELKAAEKVRVRPAELAQALHTVDVRKEAEAREQADTIPLGQAIEALGITYTAEEVLEALKAHRASQQANVPYMKVRRGWRHRAVTTVLVGSLFTCLTLGLFLARSAPMNPAITPATATLSTAPVANTAFSLQTKRLSKIAIGEEFHCDTDTLFRIAYGTASKDTVVEVGPNQNDFWRGTRGQAGLELEAWTTPTEALKLANGEEATLYRSQDQFAVGVEKTEVHVPFSRLNHGGRFPNDASLLTVAASPTKP